MSRDKQSLLEQPLIFEIQAVMVLAAVLLVEADGYDGDEIDLPEQMLLWVVAESVRRMKTREGAAPQESDEVLARLEQERIAIVRLIFACYETLQPLENGMPLAYYEQGCQMTVAFQDLRKLSDDQLAAVIMHTFLCLDAFLIEVYDFPPFFDKQRSLYEIMMYWGGSAAVEGQNGMYRVRELIPVVRHFAKQVEQGGLAEGYAPELLFA